MHRNVLEKESVPLFLKLKNFTNFYLAGGTSLALQIGHRISVDFDLFSDKEIPQSLFRKLKTVFDGCTIRPLVNNKEELTVLVDEVKVTFLHYPFRVLYKFQKYEGVKLLSVRDIAATKAYSVGRRGTFKDYIDLHAILLHKYSTLKQIIKDAERKYKQEFNDRLFLEQLVYLDDIDDVSIKFLKEKITKNKVQQFFEEKIRGVGL